MMIVKPYYETAPTEPEVELPQSVVDCLEIFNKPPKISHINQAVIDTLYSEAQKLTPEELPQLLKGLVENLTKLLIDTDFNDFVAAPAYDQVRNTCSLIVDATRNNVQNLSSLCEELSINLIKLSKTFTFKIISLFGQGLSPQNIEGLILLSDLFKKLQTIMPENATQQSSEQPTQSASDRFFEPLNNIKNISEMTTSIANTMYNQIQELNPEQFKQNLVLLIHKTQKLLIGEQFERYYSNENYIEAMRFFNSFTPPNPRTINSADDALQACKEILIILNKLSLISKVTYFIIKNNISAETTKGLSALSLLFEKMHTPALYLNEIELLQLAEIPKNATSTAPNIPNLDNSMLELYNNLKQRGFEFLYSPETTEKELLELIKALDIIYLQHECYVNANSPQEQIRTMKAIRYCQNGIHKILAERFTDKHLRDSVTN